jgi:hypothetical protein
MEKIRIFLLSCTPHNFPLVNSTSLTFEDSRIQRTTNQFGSTDYQFFLSSVYDQLNRWQERLINLLVIQRRGRLIEVPVSHAFSLHFNPSNPNHYDLPREAVIQSMSCQRKKQTFIIINEPCEQTGRSRRGSDAHQQPLSGLSKTRFPLVSLSRKPQKHNIRILPFFCPL